ncbi:MAG: hypothetical protein K9G46_15545 [Flavobacteriales bacterium]|nr:hypothetical protein [Flavobacteriales bacterium]
MVKIADREIATGLALAINGYYENLVEMRQDLISKSELVPFDELLGHKENTDLIKIFQRDKNQDKVVQAAEIQTISSSLNIIQQLEILGFLPKRFTVFSEKSKDLSMYVVSHYEALSIFLSALRHNSNTVTIRTKRTRLSNNGGLRRELLKRLAKLGGPSGSDSLLTKDSVDSILSDDKSFWAEEWNFPVNNRAAAQLLSGHWLSCFVNTTLNSQLKTSKKNIQFESLTLFELESAPEYNLGVIEFDVLALVHGTRQRIICIECKSGNLKWVLETELDKTKRRRDTLLEIAKNLDQSEDLLDFYFVVPPPLTKKEKESFQKAKREFNELAIEFISLTELRPILNRKYANL